MQMEQTADVRGEKEHYQDVQVWVAASICSRPSSHRALFLEGHNVAAPPKAGAHPHASEPRTAGPLREHTRDPRSWQGHARPVPQRNHAVLRAQREPELPAIAHAPPAGLQVTANVNVLLILPSLPALPRNARRH
jgi:hypothetical protein